MGKSTPQAPQAPNPTAVANAQADANIKTADEVAKLNRINQTSPTGSTKYTQGPDGTWSQATTLSPEEQGLLTGSQGVAQGAINSLGNTPGLTYGAYDPASIIAGQGVRANVPNSGNIQTSLDLSGIQGIPTADHAAYKQAVDSAYGQAASRLDPQWSQDQTRLETTLANQGIPQNSDAWDKAMSEFSRNKTDAYNTAENQSVLTGNTLEKDQFDMGLAANQAGVKNAKTAGDFANSAQGQQYGQNYANTNLANQAQGQIFNQEETGFGNNLSNANLNNSAVQSNLQDLISKFSLPNAVNNPSFTSVPQANIANTDVLGANRLSSEAQLANYQNQTSANSAKKGGMGQLAGTLGSAAIMSDRRVKCDIRRIGLKMNGLDLYSFRYIGKAPIQVGLMAQDVEKIRPNAVRSIGGIKHVDYQLALAA